MRIEIRGRNVEMTDDLREMVRKRFQRLGRQVSALATLEVVLSEERNPSIADSQVAEATFHLKGVTLHAREASPEMTHTMRELAEDVRRQVKKHRELRRKRSQTRQLVDQMRGRPARDAPVGELAPYRPPREGDGDDAGGSGRPQGLSAGGEGGAGGEHVVDQENAARGGRRGRGSAAAARAARRGGGRPDGGRRGGPGRARATPRGARPGRPPARRPGRSRAAAGASGAGGTGTIAPLSRCAGASHWIRSAISSATGSRRRNFSAATRLAGDALVRGRGPGPVEPRRALPSNGSAVARRRAQRVQTTASGRHERPQAAQSGGTMPAATAWRISMADPGGRRRTRGAHNVKSWRRPLCPTFVRRSGNATRSSAAVSPSRECARRDDLSCPPTGRHPERAANRTRAVPRRTPHRPAQPAAAAGDRADQHRPRRNLRPRQRDHFAQTAAGADRDAVADHRGAVDADVVADLTAAADQHRPGQLALVARGGAAAEAVDQLALALDLDRAAERVEGALAQLLEVADVVPVGVDLVRVEGHVALQQAREDVHRPVGEASRGRPAPAALLVPGAGKKSKISRAEHVDAAVGEVGERFGRVGLLLEALDTAVGAGDRDPELAGVLDPLGRQGGDRRRGTRGTRASRSGRCR